MGYMYWRGVRSRWRDVDQVVFACLWTKQPNMRSISIPKNKKGRGQYPTFLPKRAWPKKIFFYGFTVNDGEQVTGIFCVHKVVNLN